MLKKEKNETGGIDSVVKNKFLKNKFVKMVVLLLIIAGIAVAVFFAWPKIASKLNKPKPAPSNLIDQYNQDLKDLKNKANKSGSAEDLQAYGIAQYATGDQVGAIETYTKQIAKDDKNIIAHSGLANALRDQKKFDQAILEYKKVIELAPTDISAYVNLASMYQYQLNQKDKAIETYNQGIEKNPKSTDLLILEALAYEQNSDTANAKKTYEKVLATDENNAAAKAALERLSQ